MKKQIQYFQGFVFVIAALLNMVFPSVQYAQSDELCGLSAIAQSEQSIPRPSLDNELIIDRGNIRVHYTLTHSSPLDNATNQTWADSTAIYASEFWDIFANDGWPLPPSDGTMGGDNGKYDIYITNLDSETYCAEVVPELLTCPPIMCQ